MTSSIQNNCNRLNKTKKHDKYVRTGLDYVLVCKSIVSFVLRMQNVGYLICFLLFFFLATLLETNKCKNFTTVETRYNETLYNSI